MSSLGFVARLTATVTITQMIPDHRARHISIARGLARGESAIRATLLGSSSTNVNITMEESVPASKPRKPPAEVAHFQRDRKSTRLHSSHVRISYAVFCLEKKKIVDARIEGKDVARRARRCRIV